MQMMSRSHRSYHIKTFGCQMNVYDSTRMADLLNEAGYHKASSPDEADIIILNSCHIREKAAEKIYSEVGRLLPWKKQRDGVIALAGCVAQAEGDLVRSRAPAIDIIVGPQSYHHLVGMLGRLCDDPKARPTETDFPFIEKFDQLPPTKVDPGVYSAFLTIQEGCDKFCSFCVVPYTRGAEASRPASDILQEARGLVAQGVREITLLGQNVNAWHGQAPFARETSFKGQQQSGSQKWTLGYLIRALGEIEGLDRIRYTTSHPLDMDETLIAAHRDEPKLMPYLHLPVQSGSDSVLKRMNRRHSADHYRRIIDDLRSAQPDLALSTDLIVGFPGETDEDFSDTLRLVNDIGFAQAFSFKYSPRPGTPATDHAETVPEEVKASRLQTLQQLLGAWQTRFNQSCAGRELPVLFEKKGRKPAQLVGRSPYLQPVVVEADEAALGQIVPCRITDVNPNSLMGEMIPPFRSTDTKAA